MSQMSFLEALMVFKTSKEGLFINIVN